MARKLKILGTLVALAAIGVGVGAWTRHTAVAEQRAASVMEAAARRRLATLTAEDACWLAIDHYQSGKGLAGRDPFVECLGELVEVTGGYKLTRVVTQSGFMQGRLGHDLCLGRGDAWTVLGEAYRLDDCRSIPVGSADPVADAQRATRALVAADVERARTAVKTALAGPTPPETCESPAPAGSTTRLDERRLEPGVTVPQWTGMISHDMDFETCNDPDSKDPMAATSCTVRRPRTHALVARVRRIEPPRRLADSKFSGGHVDGELWLVDIAAARAVCRRPFAADMPDRVLDSAVERTFDGLVLQALRDAEAGLVVAAPP